MKTTEQLPLTLGHRTALGSEDFMPAPSNRDALGWIERWPDWPAPALVLHGPKGAGKTHLAAIWQERTGAACLDVKGLAQPLELDASGCYVIDEALPPTDEVALLQLYNRLREDRGFLLLTALLPVAQWGIRLPDLASRLLAAPAAAIGAPDDELLAALLLKMFDDRQLQVPEPVIRYLLIHMERSFAATHVLVDELDRLSLTRKRPITIPLARMALAKTADDDTGAHPAG